MCFLRKQISPKVRVTVRRRFGERIIKHYRFGVINSVLLGSRRKMDNSAHKGIANYAKGAGRAISPSFIMDMPPRALLGATRPYPAEPQSTQ